MLDVNSNLLALKQDAFISSELSFKNGDSHMPRLQDTEKLTWNYSGSFLATVLALSVGRGLAGHRGRAVISCLSTVYPASNNIISQARGVPGRNRGKTAMRGTSRLLIGLDAFSTGGNSLLSLENPLKACGRGRRRSQCRSNCFILLNGHDVPIQMPLHGCIHARLRVPLSALLTVTAETHNIKMLINN